MEKTTATKKKINVKCVCYEESDAEVRTCIHMMNGVRVCVFSLFLSEISEI